MTSFVVGFSRIGIATKPASFIGPMVSMGSIFGNARLPSDPVGTFVLTLTNVVSGSRVHVETAVAGTTLHDSVPVVFPVVISLSAYSIGSANNDLRIKVRQGTTAPKYLPFETLATALVGSASIFVSQVLDTIAS